MSKVISYWSLILSEREQRLVEKPLAWSLSLAVPLRGSKLRAASRREVQPLVEKYWSLVLSVRVASRREAEVLVITLMIAIAIINCCWI
ncbi:hypothetical protein [Nostoc sp.]|uniref:hypothetical protein n=1 Tax=Nostoc sp. TaxID=1180 RepID=UPI002FF6ACD0